MLNIKDSAIQMSMVPHIIKRISVVFMVDCNELL